MPQQLLQTSVRVKMPTCLYWVQMNPFQEASRRTLISIKKRWYHFPVAVVFTVALAANFTQDRFSLIAAGLLSLLITLALIVWRRFPSHYRRTLQDA